MSGNIRVVVPEPFEHLFDWSFDIAGTTAPANTFIEIPAGSHVCEIRMQGTGRTWWASGMVRTSVDVIDGGRLEIGVPLSELIRVGQSARSALPKKVDFSARRRRAGRD